LLDPGLNDFSYLEDYQRDNALFLFKPNPGGQYKAWTSPKPAKYVLGGNSAGKTYLLLMFAAGFLIEHPQDKGYAYWPHVPGDENLTADLRDKWRIKLPSNVWLSEESRKTHRDIVMGGWDRPDRMGLVEILGRRVRQPVKWSDEGGVWDFVEVEPYGSRLTLKTAQSGPAGYAGPPVDLGLIDEPHNPAIVKEMLARVAKAGGMLIYACTPVVDMEKPESWNNIMWLKTEILSKGNTDVVEIITGMSIDDNVALTPERRDFIKSLLTSSGMSREEQMTRLTGAIEIEAGMKFFDTNMIETLLQQTREPETGYLEVNND